jgi:class 3 adenylate cyclase
MSGNGRGGLRRRLEVTLVGVALVSVLLLSGINYVFARVLITDAVESQLEALRDTRVQAIERGAERVKSDVATLAVTPSVITALDELAAGYAAIDDELTASQLAELEALYDDAFEPLRAIGREVPTSSVLPTSERGRVVQYRYIAQNPDGFDERDGMDDAGDGSAYSAAHAEYHPLLRALMRNARLSDLMLVDAGTRDVVYSVKKRIDIGTNTTNGPWSDGALGAVIAQLASSTVGDTIISDTSFYVPAGGQAVVFVATAIRSGAEVTGAIIAEVPVAAITALVTAGQDWELLGLEQTGDVYLVGADGTLRTDPRAWLDDPEGFLSDHLDREGDEEAIEQMRLVGSPALTQTVDNRAIDAALDGDEFVGAVSNYRGDATFTATGPVRLGDQSWTVVVEQDRAEATEGLASLLRSTLVVMAILLPVTAVLGWWLARSLTRPFGDLVDAANRIARGDPAPGVGRLGNNEVGDVGRQLQTVAEMLEAEEAAIVAEEAQINAVLGAVVPPRLVERVRCGEEQISDLIDTATAISFVVDGVPEAVGSNQDTVYEITEQLVDSVEELRERLDVERVRRSTTNALFVAGLGAPDARIEAAAEFAAAVIQLVAETGAEYGQQLTVRAGISAGDVASGVIGQQQLTFSVWGEPVTAAFALASMARPGEILVDGTVQGALAGSHDFDRRDGLAGLDDDVDAWSLRPSPPIGS